MMQKAHRRAFGSIFAFCRAAFRRGTTRISPRPPRPTRSSRPASRSRSPPRAPRRSARIFKFRQTKRPPLGGFFVGHDHLEFRSRRCGLCRLLRVPRLQKQARDIDVCKVQIQAKPCAPPSPRSASRRCICRIARPPRNLNRVLTRSFDCDPLRDPRLKKCSLRWASTEARAQQKSRPRAAALSAET